MSVLDGEVWDVAVDIRRGSPTFGKWEAILLTAENRRHFWIPEGFAHGFAVLSEKATLTYLCTDTYDREAAAGIRWKDPRSEERRGGNECVSTWRTRWSP